MISDQSDLRVQIRRLFVIMVRTSYRWIRSHPFLLSFVGFSYLLHRTCPLLFSSLVAVSPLLVCTFILLGTILSFGDSNIPEIEIEPETTAHVAAPSRTDVPRDATIVERGGNSVTVERFVSTTDGNDDTLQNHLSEVEDEGCSFDYKPLVDETLDEVKRDTQVRFEEKAFVLGLEKRDEELVEDVGKQIMDDLKDDQIDVSPVSPWRPMRHEEDEDDDDADRDESLDSESDGAESSSPDASMTDIIPMLDELHPLLHLESQSCGIVDGEGSDESSEGPDESSSSSSSSSSDVESHEEERNNENNDENGEEEEEEKKEEKEDESKSAIKWTEADQKNVMDLGSLELERNQRLENLIARRRARHNMRLMTERNLIDFDTADIPFNMAPISTARQNPFDLSYDDMGLPPIPGSAPSIMFARRNPFDLPYEPNEEKPDLKGDGFKEEFSPQQPKEPVFRRHESFSVGPSMLGGHRHDRLRPFFALERLANSYYPYERQLSEVSESKVSSVPDTESVCTVLEDDEKKLDGHDAVGETENIEVDMASDHDEVKIPLASDHDEEKSHSDFDEQPDSRSIHHHVAEIVLGSSETHHESNISDGETSDKRNLDEEGSSDSDSSILEKGEKKKEDEISDISENEATLISEKKVDLYDESSTSQPSFGGLEDVNHHDEVPAGDSFITEHPSLEESAINDLYGLVDDHHVAPVYDSSPSGSRFPSFSSISSDYRPDSPGKHGEEVQENIDKEREIYTEIGETSTGEESLLIPDVGIVCQNNLTVSGSESEDALPGPSLLPLDKNEIDVHQEDNPLGVSSQEDLKGQYEDVKEAVDTRALDVNTSLVEATGKVEQHLPVEYVTTLEKLHDKAETSVNRSVADEIMPEEEEAIPQTSNADIPVDSYSTLSSGAVEYVETHSFNKGDVPQLEQYQVQSSVSDSEEETHSNQTTDIQVDGSGQEVAPFEPNRELTWSDKSVVGQSSLDPTENQMPTHVVFSRNITFHEYHDAPEDADELSCLTSDTSSTPADSPEYKTPMVGEGSSAEFFQEAVYDELFDHLEGLDELTDLHAISQSPPPPDVITEEGDEIKEIDEGLLFELDTIGDFSVKEVVTGSEPGPSSIESAAANELTESLEPVYEGSEVDDAVLPSTVQGQLAQENYENPAETESDLAVVEATSNENLENALDQAAVESMGKQPKSLESDGGSGEEESRLKEIETTETRSLEEIQRPKEGMEMEVKSERVATPTEVIGSSNVTSSDDVVTDEAKSETADVQNPDSRETGGNSRETDKKEEE